MRRVVDVLLESIDSSQQTREEGSVTADEEKAIKVITSVKDRCDRCGRDIQRCSIKRHRASYACAQDWLRSKGVNWKNPTVRTMGGVAVSVKDDPDEPIWAKRITECLPATIVPAALDRAFDDADLRKAVIDVFEVASFRGKPLDVARAVHRLFESEVKQKHRERGEELEKREKKAISDIKSYQKEQRHVERMLKDREKDLRQIERSKAKFALEKVPS